MSFEAVLRLAFIVLGIALIPILLNVSRSILERSRDGPGQDEDIFDEYRKRSNWELEQLEEYASSICVAMLHGIRDLKLYDLGRMTDQTFTDHLWKVLNNGDLYRFKRLDWNLAGGKIISSNGAFAQSPGELASARVSGTDYDTVSLVYQLPVNMRLNLTSNSATANEQYESCTYRARFDIVLQKIRTLSDFVTCPKCGGRTMNGICMCCEYEVDVKMLGWWIASITIG